MLIGWKNHAPAKNLSWTWNFCPDRWNTWNDRLPKNHQFVLFSRLRPTKGCSFCETNLEKALFAYLSRSAWYLPHPTSWWSSFQFDPKFRILNEWNHRIKSKNMFFDDSSKLGDANHLKSTKMKSIFFSVKFFFSSSVNLCVAFFQWNQWVAVNTGVEWDQKIVSGSNQENWEILMMCFHSTFNSFINGFRFLSVALTICVSDFWTRNSKNQINYSRWIWSDRWARPCLLIIGTDQNRD